MKCPECLCEQWEEIRVDWARVRDGRPVLIKNIPVSACIQCHYEIINIRVAEEMEAALKGIPSSQVTADVFDVSAVQPGPPMPRPEAKAKAS